MFIQFRFRTKPKTTGRVRSGQLSRASCSRPLNTQDKSTSNLRVTYNRSDNPFHSDHILHCCDQLVFAYCILRVITLVSCVHEWLVVRCRCAPSEGRGAQDAPPAVQRPAAASSTAATETGSAGPASRAPDSRPFQAEKPGPGPRQCLGQHARLQI